MFLPIICILMSIWLYQEAKARNKNKALWAIAGLIFSFLAIGVFHLKHKNRVQGIVAIILGLAIYSINVYDFFF